MKLLITMSEENEWGHTLSDDHVKQIETAFPDLEVAVALGEATEEQSRDADILAGFPVRIPKVTEGMKVRWIHTLSAGVDYVLTPEVKAREDIVVSNSSGIHAIPITEHVIGLILSYNQQFPRIFRDQAVKKWEKNVNSSELHGKTVTIVGLGAIGSQLAKTLKAFDCTVHGVVRTIREAPSYVDSLCTSDTMQEVLAVSDYVVICLPGSPETKGMFDAKVFGQMKESGVIVNIGRGTIINQDDLIEALENKTIAGALLDVTTPEPLPPESPLWSMPNVIITPHCSSATTKAMDRIIDRLCLNIDAFIKEEKLPNEVDKKLGY